MNTETPIHECTSCQLSGHRFNEDGFCPDCGEHEEPKKKPLGGKTSLGTSAVVAADLAAFNDYRSKMDSVLARHGGAINSEEAALELRGVIASFMPETKKVMAQLSLTF